MEKTNLNILPTGGVLPIVHCSQGDIGRQFQINLYSDGVPYILDGTEELTIDGHKDDNNIFSYSLDPVTGSTITISTEEQMTACAGNVVCEIRIYKGNTRLGTCNFIIQVEEGPSNGTPSASTLQSLDEIRAEIQQAVEDTEAYADISKAWAVGPNGSGSGSNTNNSKYYSQQSASSATASANSASAAHTSELNAAASESNAATSATNSANSATTSTQKATLAESWAVGGTGTRTGENTNNSKYYSQQASTSATNAANSASAASTSATEAADSASVAESQKNTAILAANTAASHANDAGHSADAAATSETNAANSASAASTSETNAASSASAASTSETNAKNWAVGPSGSGSGTNTNNAKYYATQASTSATNAANSASTATTKASEASTSATNAANSATSASTSAGTATTKANAASTSATNAANSASAASTSETNAASSANSASTSATDAKNWAVGPSGSGSGTNINNAKYYANQANSAKSNAINAKNDAVSAKLDAVSAKNDAVSAKNSAESSAADSKNWAVGPSGTGSGTDSNNSKYYANQASSSASDAINAKTSAEAAEQKIENMTVSASQLPEGSSPTVNKSEIGGVVNLAFGIPKGDTGDTGPRGADGLGVPAGGTTGQVLSKASDTDNDTEWITPSGGASWPMTYDNDLVLMEKSEWNSQTSAFEVKPYWGNPLYGSVAATPGGYSDGAVIGKIYNKQVYRQRTYDFITLYGSSDSGPGHPYNAKINLLAGMQSDNPTAMDALSRVLEVQILVFDEVNGYAWNADGKDPNGNDSGIRYYFQTLQGDSGYSLQLYIKNDGATYKKIKVNVVTTSFTLS